VLLNLYANICESGFISQLKGCLVQELILDVNFDALIKKKLHQFEIFLLNRKMKKCIPGMVLEINVNPCLPQFFILLLALENDS
jgi:hypothetical protein